MADSVKLALITEGGAPHVDIYLDCIASAHGVRELAVADSSAAAFEPAKEKLAGRFGSIPLYTQYDALLQERQPELVIVSLPAADAPAAIEAALKSNCHVVAEKPACVRWEDFERLRALAQARRSKLMLAFATRMNPLAIKARDVVRAGRLGKLYGANMYFLADQTRLRRPEYGRSWVASKKRAGGGHLIWLGIHYVDAVQFICGQRISKIGGFIANVGGQPFDVEDSAAVTMEFEGGMLATLQSGYYLDRAYQSQIQIWGSDGWLRTSLASGAPLEWHSHRAARTETFAAGADSQANVYPHFIQAAINSVRLDTAPPVTANECLQTLKAVFGLYRSASDGRAQQI